MLKVSNVIYSFICLKLYIFSRAFAEIDNKIEWLN